jgi:HK97 family phage major capsid protein
MKGLKRGVSKQIPATLGAGTDSVAFVGDFSQMVLCIRSPLRLELARGAGDSFAKAQIQLRLIMRADVVILREKFFTKITGLKAS